MDETVTPPLTRADCGLIAQAARNRWEVSEGEQARVLDRLLAFFQPACDRPADRTVIAAARAVGALAKLGLQQQQLDLARQRLELEHPEAAALLPADVETLREYLAREPEDEAPPSG